MNHKDTKDLRLQAVTPSMGEPGILSPSLICLLLQPESEQRAAYHDADVLLAVHRVAHWACSDRAPQIRLPEQFAVTGIKRKKLAVAAAAEQNIGGRGQNAGFGRRRGLSVVPLLFAGPGIDGPHGAVD